MVNDDWNDSQGEELSEIWGSALPFLANSKSSAAVLTLEPGNYTAIVEGKNGTSGIALVEVWRLESPGADGQFLNISSRALVETEDEVMIGGFIIQDGAQQVAIHAIGPELEDRGVSNALADPVIRVIDTTDPNPANFRELMVNDDWNDSQGQLISEIWGPFLPFSAGSKSSAAVLTLEPGSYTAIVEGKDGTSGIALVEAWRLGSPDTLERKALMAFYHATDGPNWRWSDNWGTDAPLDQWYGVSVDENGHVFELWLFENHMSGSIPPELGNLTNLTQFNFGVNDLSGEIPGELGNLINLDWLKIDRNRLSGPIPPELGRLVNLQSIDLSENQLSGSIPAELGNLANLQYLGLYDNQLSGPIPPELGNLTDLNRLDLENNQLSGPIPEELGNLANLHYLGLHENQLSGPIPAELGSLSNLERLLLHDNQLSGLIPPELGNLANLNILELDNNQLSGPIPPELGSLANLWVLDLEENQLTGPIPAELGRLGSLQSIYLSENQLSGPIPDSFLEIKSLESFHLHSNDGLCVPAGAAFDAWLAGIPLQGFGSLRCVPNSTDLSSIVNDGQSGE